MSGRVVPGSLKTNVVAILAFRNEEAYLANAIRHLVEHDIQVALIDNGSEDGSRRIAESPEFAPHVVALDDLPFDGYFELTRLLEAKARLAERLDADWVIHVDADEELHSYVAGETLREAIARVDRAGYNVIDFDELVFLPVERDYVPDSRGPQPILTYYFFQPTAPRLMRAWRKSARLSNVEHGGHRLSGADVRLAPETMALRHYIVLSQSHAFVKYTDRRFAPEECARGWHKNRLGHAAAAFAFPPSKALHRLPSPASRDFVRDLPRVRHYWEWGPGSEGWGS